MHSRARVRIYICTCVCVQVYIAIATARTTTRESSPRNHTILRASANTLRARQVNNSECLSAHVCVCDAYTRRVSRDSFRSEGGAAAAAIIRALA